MTKNTKILAVFKEDENMKAAVKLLADKGFDVCSNASVFQAIATITKRKTDAMILDIDDLESKEMEFFDVVKKINQDLFILVSFSSVNREKAIKALKRGTDCYILKPFYVSELLAIICNFLDKTSHNKNIIKETLKNRSSIERMALRVAHEINNPLATISGQLQLLLSERKNDVRQSSVEANDSNYHVYTSLEEETQRIAESVKNLVTFAQLKEPNKTSVNLNDVLKDVIYSLKNTDIRQSDIRPSGVRLSSAEVSVEGSVEANGERNIQIVEAFDKDLPMIMADKEQIALVCKNIIDNSRKALNQSGTGKAVGSKETLKISTESKNGSNVNVIFYDPNRGIPTKVIGAIFDPFTVVNEAEGGMGLELCISYNIIKRHGGDLTVTSQKDKGTVFQLTLPLEKHFYFRKLLEE